MPVISTNDWNIDDAEVGRSSTGLDPDECLVADQRKVYAKHLKYRVHRNQRGYFRGGW
jgi:hypothetical protein